MMTETKFERVFIDGMAELLPNYTIEKLLYKNFEEVGSPSYTEDEIAFAAALKETYEDVTVFPGIGPMFDEEIADIVREKTDGLKKPLCEFLLPQFNCNGFVAGSTDVGDVSWQTPAAQINAVCFPLGAPGHSWQNVSCGKTSIAHKGMLTAAKVLACTAIDLYEKPDALGAARAEFGRRARSGYVCPIEPGAKPVAI
jgi:aminobenzoyl-glutamate utilization protein B